MVELIARAARTLEGVTASNDLAALGGLVRGSPYREGRGPVPLGVSVPGIVWPPERSAQCGPAFDGARWRPLEWAAATVAALRDAAGVSTHT